MEENYILSVTGKQTVAGDSDKVELKTTAAYVMRNGSRYISYNEYDIQNPGRKYRTTVKIDPDNRVTVMKGGEERHNLILEKGVRHRCEYMTSFGSIMLGVYTESVRNELGDDGGRIQVRYNIDVEYELASTNELTLEIQEAKGNDNISIDTAKA